MDDHYTFTISKIFVVPIEYGEMDMLEDEEKNALMSFLNKYPKGNWVYHNLDDTYIARCAITDMMSDCCIATLTPFED